MPITFYDPYQAQRQQQQFMQELMQSFVLNRMQENLLEKKLANEKEIKIQDLQSKAQIEGWQIADENRQTKEGEEPPRKIKIGDLSFEKPGLSKLSIGGVPGVVQPNGQWQALPVEKKSWEKIEDDKGTVFLQPDTGKIFRTPFNKSKEYAPGSGKQLAQYYDINSGQMVQKSFDLEQGGTVPANFIPASDEKQVSYHRHLKSMGLKPSDLTYPEYQQMLDPKQAGEKGELSESAALEQLNSLSQYEPAKQARAMEEFYKLRKPTEDGRPGLRPGEALVAVSRKLQREDQEADFAKRLPEIHKKYSTPESILWAVKDGELSSEQGRALMTAFHKDYMRARGLK